MTTLAGFCHDLAENVELQKNRMITIYINIQYITIYKYIYKSILKTDQSSRFDNVTLKIMLILAPWDRCSLKILKKKTRKSSCVNAKRHTARRAARVCCADLSWWGRYLSWRGGGGGTYPGRGVPTIVGTPLP